MRTLLEFNKVTFTSGGGGTDTQWWIMDNFEYAVPEPTTMIAGALLLLPFGASTLRILRRRTA